MKVTIDASALVGLINPRDLWRFRPWTYTGHYSTLAQI